MRDSVNNTTAAALGEAHARLSAIAQIGGLDPDDECEDFAMRVRVLWEILGNPTMSDDVREHVLRQYERPALRRKGRRSTKRRDIWITFVIRQLVDKHGLTPTRNRESVNDSAPTACGIVAKALKKLGTKPSEAGVNAIWSRRHGPRLLQREVSAFVSAMSLSPKEARFMFLSRRG